MNKKVIMFVIAGLMLCSASYAQEVVTGSNGEAIINCSGMKPSSYTTTMKPRTATGTGLADDLSSSVNNTNVYKRFEVSKTNDGRDVNWSAAITLCADKSGGNWRLPTQRELMLMWVLRPELYKVSGFTPFDSYYHWSATQNGANGSYVNLNTGNTNFGFKPLTPRVRCIRDL